MRHSGSGIRAAWLGGVALATGLGLIALANSLVLDNPGAMVDDWVLRNAGVSILVVLATIVLAGRGFRIAAVGLLALGLGVAVLGGLAGMSVRPGLPQGMTRPAAWAENWFGLGVLKSYPILFVAGCLLSYGGWRMRRGLPPPSPDASTSREPGEVDRGTLRDAE
jgi:hypothetical protein